MISAGCVIEGTVINSVLSPGVHVKKGAVIRDSVIFEDSIIDKGAVVDLAICDKLVHIGEKAVVGHGENKDAANRAYPKHLYTGITLIGKKAKIPPLMQIGRSCIVAPGRQAKDFAGYRALLDGDSL
jgi:glucose-1-phosphate adenylyltransferase